MLLIMKNGGNTATSGSIGGRGSSASGNRVHGSSTTSPYTNLIDQNKSNLNVFLVFNIFQCKTLSSQLGNKEFDEELYSEDEEDNDHNHDNDHHNMHYNNEKTDNCLNVSNLSSYSLEENRPLQQPEKYFMA